MDAKPASPQRLARPRRFGFSIIELMVAMSILLVVLGIILTMTNQASQAWSYSASKVEAFQGARFAFETITRSIASATLNTYYDYYDASFKRREQGNAATFVPHVYGRCSELAFISGKNLLTTPQQVTHAAFFQTPLNYTENEKGSVEHDNYLHVQGLLNVTGFFIEWANTADAESRPSFFPSTPRYRYRLMQLLEPTEEFSVYKNLADGIAVGDSWFTGPISGKSSYVRVLAENIIACVIWPKLPKETPTTPDGTNPALAPGYEYSTTVDWKSGDQPVTMHQLPPVVRVVLVAVDERSMNRLQGTSSSEPHFGQNTLFNSASSLEQDLEDLGEKLTDLHINYRIFQTDVAILGAKWSK